MPADRVTFDVFLVTLTVPRRLPEAAARQIRAVTDRAAFRGQLRRAARDLCRRHPALAAVVVTVTQ